jgi:hypothetical protein
LPPHLDEKYARDANLTIFQTVSERMFSETEAVGRKHLLFNWYDLTTRLRSVSLPTRARWRRWS